MKNKEMKEKVKKAFEHATPDVLDSVIEDCKDQKGKVILMTKQNNRWIKRSLAVAAIFAVIIVGAFSIGRYRVGHSIASTVSLDVNPGVEIKVNKENVVLEVKPINDDGEKVVDDLDFKGSKLDVALHALIGSMVKNGYITDFSNSILVSVEGKDETKNEELQSFVSAKIEEILSGSKLRGAVLSQKIHKDSEIEKLAAKYGISVGKAQVVNEIAKQNKNYDISDLVKLSINELNLISEGKQIGEVKSTGTASSKAYIGKEKAKEVAFKKAGVKESEVRDLEVELDLEKGVLVYQVDFDTKAYEFEYDINATSGKIVEEKKEPTGYVEVEKPSQQNTSYISESEAKSVALKHAGVKASSVVFEKVELDSDDGVMVYEVDFRTSSYEYDYKVNAKSGKILEVDKERRDREDREELEEPKEEKPAQTKNDFIGTSKAKNIALGRAGVKSSETRDWDIELDREGGTYVYEVSFETAKYEFEYTINATTGKVLRAEKERADD